MEAMVSRMAEDQQHLEKVMKKFLSAATEDRETFQKAMTTEEEQIDKVAQTQDAAIGKLTNVLGQQRGHTALPSVVL
ncbi:hypothetical protein NDU88_005687 [Pleurodeles waltl]|uniref:Uncharacterized protein n=1 Tax=Pleurodeles waltl TaxID=8319 RepID=A0AAV7WZF9_PLEWA|nr:hypothetical protein NDU88_005687 [Pleurodeles waltl]